MTANSSWQARIRGIFEPLNPAKCRQSLAVNIGNGSGYLGHRF